MEKEGREEAKHRNENDDGDQVKIDMDSQGKEKIQPKYGRQEENLESLRRLVIKRNSLRQLQKSVVNGEESKDERRDTIVSVTLDD